jgi:hypothetical protein
MSTRNISCEGGLKCPVRRVNNLTTFMCQLSWNLGASTSWNPQGLSRPVMGMLYLYILIWKRIVLYRNFGFVWCLIYHKAGLYNFWRFRKETLQRYLQISFALWLYVTLRGPMTGFLWHFKLTIFQKLVDPLEFGLKKYHFKYKTQNLLDHNQPESYRSEIVFAPKL